MLSALCLWDRRVAPFGRYLVEMLHAEGLTGAREHEVSHSPISLQDLRDHHIVLVAPCSEDAETEATALAALQAGTAVIFLRPSRATAARLGLHAGRSRVANDFYLAPNRVHPLWFTALGDYLQFHGGADLYDRSENTVAWIAGPEWATSHPAIVTGVFGAGRFAVFAYDLATSTVLFHQGLAELASTGSKPDSDGDGTFAPNDLFQGHLDVNLRHVPQADLQQRLLLRILDWACEETGPLPRLWPFPNAESTVALINGDSDLMTLAQLERFVNMTEAHGGGYTIYVLEEHRELVTPDLAADYRRRGHSVGPHIWLKLKPTPSEMAARIREEVSGFTDYYDRPPKTTRHHCVVWPGWVDTARALADSGLRLETNYRAAERYQSGYLTGSGLPMRFIDEAGELIECFQQETLLCDDYALVDKSFLPPLSEAQVIDLSRRLLGDARERYYTAVQIYFHPVYSTGLTVHTGQFIHTAGWLEAVLKYCRQNQISMPNTDAWCEFNERRRQTIIEESHWDPTTGKLTFVVNSATGLPGTTLVLPTYHSGRQLQSVVVGSTEFVTEEREIHGGQYTLSTGDLAPERNKAIAQYVAC